MIPYDNIYIMNLFFIIKKIIFIFQEAEIVFNSTQTGCSTDSEDLKKGIPSTASELLSGWYFAPKEKVNSLYFNLRNISFLLFILGL